MISGRLGLNEIIRRLRQNQPTTVEELLVDCHLPISFAGYGAFRDAWEIYSTAYVIKLPIRDGGEWGQESNIIHTTAEINAYNRIMKSIRYRPLRQWMPIFHYTNKPTGLILTEYYKQIPDKKGKFDEEINQIEKLCKRWGFRGDNDADLCIKKRENFGVDKKGKLRILDLGCFTKGKAF